MFDTLQEHLDFHYATETELDRADAYQIGSFHPERAWVVSDRDVWHANPYYKGLPVPHPEDDQGCEEFHANPEAWRARHAELKAAPPVSNFDDIPF